MNPTFDTAHTPGPWKAEPKRLKLQTAHGVVEGPVMSYLAGNAGTGGGMTVSIASERHADHYLCAAAPDLLAALERLCVILDKNPKLQFPAENSPIGQAKAAIAKAKGIR